MSLVAFRRAILTASATSNGGRLAHRIAAYRGGNIVMDFTADKAMFDDILQRAYTDDGNGDGHVTAAGLRLMSNIAENKPLDYIPDVTWLIGPGLSALIAGRAETRDVADRFFEELISARQGPPWQWDSERIAASENWLKDLAQGTLAIRYAFPSLLLPRIAHMSKAAERAIQQRDATEVAIALVLFQRRHGVWPQKLDELVPDLLPAVPPDRLDGQPLRYIVREGRPVRTAWATTVTTTVAVRRKIPIWRSRDHMVPSNIPRQSLTTTVTGFFGHLCHRSQRQCQRKLHRCRRNLRRNPSSEDAEKAWHPGGHLSLLVRHFHDSA